MLALRPGFDARVELAEMVPFDRTPPAERRLIHILVGWFQGEQPVERAR